MENEWNELHSSINISVSSILKLIHKGILQEREISKSKKNDEKQKN